MKPLNTIVELLTDSQWHRLEDIKKQINLQEEVFNSLLFFLKEQRLLEIENEKLRITPRGLEFLDLPYPVSPPHFYQSVK
jgi:predicted transcriptional regulator